MPIRMNFILIRINIQLIGFLHRLAGDIEIHPFDITAVGGYFHRLPRIFCFSLYKSIPCLPAVSPAADFFDQPDTHDRHEQNKLYPDPPFDFSHNDTPCPLTAHAFFANLMKNI